MEIQIGESIFLGGDSDYKLSPPVQGLESAAFRVGDGLYAGRDGGYVSGHFYGHRTLTLKGFYIGDNCEDASRLRKVLFELLRIRYRLPILITTAEGQYYTEGYVTDIKADIERLETGEFQMVILCPDPTLYKAEDGVVIEIQEQLAIGDTTVIQNDGGVEVYPIITIVGAFDNIEINNTISQLAMQLDLETTESTDRVVIDMGKRMITLNGEIINEFRSLGSSWWSLLQEENDISVSVGSGTPEITIKYKEGYPGI